jgi:hypothetical protein
VLYLEDAELIVPNSSRDDLGDAIHRVYPSQKQLTDHTGHAT